MELLKNIGLLYIERWEFFQELILQHLTLSLIAIFFITIIGLTIGILITYHQKVAKITLGIVNVIYTIPSIALFGILVSFSGIGQTSALIALILYGLLPIIRTTYVGIIELDKDTIEAAKAMGTPPLTLLFQVQLPLSLPYIMAGFKNMVVMTIALGAIASFIGAGGLGVGIWRGITTNNATLTMASSILVAILALGSDVILGFIERKLNKIYK